MTTAGRPNKLHHAEYPARRLLERLGWTYAPRQALAAKRWDERDVLLRTRLRRALLRLNGWLTGPQADRVVSELKNVNATGMACNQAVHECPTDAASLRRTGVLEIWPKSGVARGDGYTWGTKHSEGYGRSRRL